MDINITLVLQALLFACSYCFLYKFLFAPSCTILQEEEQLKQDLYLQLEKEQQVKDALLQDYHVKNHAFKTALIQAIPQVVTQADDQKTAVPSTSHVAQPVVVSEQNIEQTESFLVEHLSQVIKK